MTKFDERVVPGQTEITNVCRHIARYNFALPVVQNESVIDLGCGSGYGTFLLSLVSKRVLGIDSDFDTVEKARVTYPNCVFGCDDILKLKNMRASVIVCFEVIEHIEDTKKLIEVIDSILLPGGHLIYSVPLDEEMGWNPHHEHTYTKDTASKIFSYEQLNAYYQEGIGFHPEYIEGRTTQYIGLYKKPVNTNKSN